MWANQIRNWMNVPLDIGDLPVKGKWNGVHKHIGADSYTPLKRSLAFKHVSGLCTIMSGMMLWMSARLASRVDTSALDELAVALFCYQQDNLYYRSPEARASLAEIDAADRFQGPVLYILDEWYNHRSRADATWPVHPPHNMVGSMLEMARYVMGADGKIVFDAWITETIARMNELVPFPGHSSVPQKYDVSQKAALSLVSMGPPVPPTALDRSITPEPKHFATQWQEFLTSVTWQQNRFLRPPDEMTATGFPAVPYRESR
jgi:hypothetical protein